MFSPEFTWRCDFCQKEKSDYEIDVRHLPITGLESSFPDTRYNLKFCITNECRAKALAAKKWDLNTRTVVL